MNAELCCKKSLFGKYKLTDDQVGWAAGFCDAACQEFGLDEIASFAVTAVIFDNVFGKVGQIGFKRLLHSQQNFLASMQSGGNAYLNWGRSGNAPLMPFG